jgi:chondroitin 4-sulfotransferase 11
MPSILVSRRLKVAYVAIPKVACRSIKIALAKPYGVAYQADIHNARWDRFSSLQELAAAEDYFRFTVVRNPWDRVASCYYHKVHLVHRDPTRQWILGSYDGLLRPSMSFPEFVAAVAKIPDAHANEHFASQWPMISHSGTLAVDHVVRFEKLAAEWQSLQSRFPFPDLPHENKTDHPPYRELYCNDTRQFVAERYAQDIAKLDYCF